MNKITEEFKEAVNSYLDAIGEAYSSRMGEEPDTNPHVERIKGLFQGIPTEVRVSYLYFLLKTMFERVGGERLTEWRRDLGLQLVKSLEKI